MRYLIALWLIPFTTLTLTSQMQTPFEKNNAASATYHEAISYFKDLQATYSDYILMREAGPTDSGHPLHMIVISGDGIFDPDSVRATGRVVMMINNAIHPGEPEGIDASMILCRDLMTNPEYKALLDHVVIVMVPVYNIGGCLNRGSHSRANQNGPEEYGFRGNARNYDLNRDFVKCDSRNAKAFSEIFNYWHPDVLVDNHTSNGADYQYTMTLIATQHNKLPKPLGQYLQEAMLPFLYQRMEEAKWEMTPYVNTDEETPDEGIEGFLDHPRYSSGYASMFHCLSFMPETHMLKPFADRVHSTHAFMHVMLQFLDKHYENLKAARKQAEEYTRTTPKQTLQWTLDKTKADRFMFKGYEAGHKPSAVSGLPRLYYDRSKPYAKEIKYYNTFKPSLTVDKPRAYMIPQAYDEVIERLRLNGVKLTRIETADTVEIEQYYIEEFKTTSGPYEGHYLHSGVKLRTVEKSIILAPGDYLVVMGRNTDRYVMEVLEPQGEDSFFAWNFFDAILQQKEYFSAYVFEDLAAEYLAEHPELRKKLDDKKAADPVFAASAEAQLEFVYLNSPWYEPTHKAYPVLRIKNKS